MSSFSSTVTVQEYTNKKTSRAECVSFNRRMNVKIIQFLCSDSTPVTARYGRQNCEK